MGLRAVFLPWPPKHWNGKQNFYAKASAAPTDKVGQVQITTYKLRSTGDKQRERLLQHGHRERKRTDRCSHKPVFGSWHELGLTEDGDTDKK